MLNLVLSDYGYMTRVDKRRDLQVEFQCHFSVSHENQNLLFFPEKYYHLHNKFLDYIFYYNILIIHYLLSFIVFLHIYRPYCLDFTYKNSIVRAYMIEKFDMDFLPLFHIS
jgi:hypothetical protein